MSRAGLIRKMRAVVPSIIAVLVVGDIALSYIDDAATYTETIRSWVYSWPALKLGLAGALGAVWAHLCWTPGAEIEAIKADLNRMGYGNVTQNDVFGRINCYQVTLVNGTSRLIQSEWKFTALGAWRNVEQRVRAMASIGTR